LIEGPPAASTPPVDPDPALVCLDIGGTLLEDASGPPLPGAVDAVRALRECWPVRLVTNTTSVPFSALVDRLVKVGILDDPGHLVTPVMVARVLLPKRGHQRGILISDPAQRDDYAWFEEAADGPAVLLATEAHEWRIRDLQPAFRRLLDGAAFYTLTRNRYYRTDGELRTDVGGAAALLAYCGGREPETLGKPSALLFDAVARAAGVPREAIVMVGDDAEVDVAASAALGMRGILVRTGKYRAGDEGRVSPRPTAVLDSVAGLPEWLARQDSL
jgi:HAD superfamily hydrolase (TIGR01458 family)